MVSDTLSADYFGASFWLHALHLDWSAAGTPVGVPTILSLQHLSLQRMSNGI